MHGDTDNTPYGLGTYASRSTPTVGAATAMVARRVREKATKLAAHLLEVSEEDIEYEEGRFSVKGAPDRVKYDPGGGVRRLHRTSPTGWNRGSRRSSTTTRRT